MPSESSTSPYTCYILPFLQILNPQTWLSLTSSFIPASFYISTSHATFRISLNPSTPPTSAPPWPYFCYFSCGSKTSVWAQRTSTQWKPSISRPLRLSSGPSCTVAPWSPLSSPVLQIFQISYMLTQNPKSPVSLNYKTKAFKMLNYISAHLKVSKYVLSHQNSVWLSVIGFF